ncbi:ABC-type transport auxiliary lipoprotein family protein [Sphingobium sp. SA2]|uniref:ABC-type transport auxiliary lipoprotein family protein n=1 Tax=Sphingobium sp. SA2 TaxID=1524832 RepID=UPI0028C20329|nr:ABC-type transport auxiliary lipoprotein family protein [Sphingobium sp. SA2]MDT7536040.1 ABC-type transport auxiliary lipoprotein family protein [Sphingobium sp. SA2]
MMRLASILLLLMLPACAALKGGDAPVTMRVSPRFAPGPVQPTPTLAVAPVQARGLSGGLRYAYVDAATPGEIRQASTLFWEEPPATMLARALVAGLRTRFAAVTGPDLSLAADRRVVATLDRFEEVTSAGVAQAVVAFDVTQVAQGKAVWTGRYCATQPIAAAAGTVRAAAFQGAIEQAVAAFVEDAVSGKVTAAPC